MKGSRTWFIVVVAGMIFVLLLAACQPAAQATTGAGVDSPAETEAGGDQTPETGSTEAAGGETAATCDSGKAAAELQSAGEQVYATTCAGCHGPQGEGQADFPPLADSELATSEDLVALAQKITNPEVHPFITTISADDLAAALTFVRGSFGNAAAFVCPEDIPLPASE